MQLIHLLEDSPSLELICIINTPEIVICAALGSYSTFEWLDYSDNGLKHCD